jgi:ATP:cob(I)alamin adenosyltransferase
MSIVTKTGDNGMTLLYSGEKVKKSDNRVEAYGTVDELNSHIGEIKHLTNKEIAIVLESIQRDLFIIMSELASLKVTPKNIQDKDVERLTSMVHKYEKDSKYEGFVVPGKTKTSAKIDICRTICRRAERQIVKLAESEAVSETILSYINRLSDFLFVIQNDCETSEHIEK